MITSDGNTTHCTMSHFIKHLLVENNTLNRGTLARPAGNRNLLHLSSESASDSGSKDMLRKFARLQLRGEFPDSRVKCRQYLSVATQQPDYDIAVEHQHTLRSLRNSRMWESTSKVRSCQSPKAAWHASSVSRIFASVL
jgi:hypothetical protein